MASVLRFGSAVIYADDVAATVEFYARITGLAPSYFDRELGFALLGAEQTLAIASHAAGTLMLAAGYERVRGERVRGAEIAFWADDVAAAFENAVRAGAAPLTPPRVMPWGQTVAYVEAPEGTIVGFVTPAPAGAVMDQRASELISILDLRPHPEGGFYREIFRSTAQVAPGDGRGSRAALTTIYFLLAQGSVSRWHRVLSDEVWHLHEGGPLELLELTASGRELRRHRLGPIDGGEGAPMCTIAAGHWQAARPLAGYALVGCTVGPGFDFADFRLLADEPEAAARLRAAWPDLAPLL